MIKIISFPPADSLECHAVTGPSLVTIYGVTSAGVLVELVDIFFFFFIETLFFFCFYIGISKQLEVIFSGNLKIIFCSQS